MSSFNRVTLLGSVGRDPEVKHFEGGGKLVKFSMATNEKYKNRNGEMVENTEWHNIVVSRKGLSDTAEKHVKKGGKILIEGKLKTRSWEDGGVKKYMTEIVVDNLTFVQRPPQAGQQQASTQTQAGQTPTTVAKQDGDPYDDDLPF